jgi:hypothetical protein
VQHTEKSKTKGHVRLRPLIPRFEEIPVCIFFADRELFPNGGSHPMGFETAVVMDTSTDPYILWYVRSMYAEDLHDAMTNKDDRSLNSGPIYV